MTCPSFRAITTITALTASLAAQDWTLAAPGAFTPVRNGACAAYDLIRQEVVMFGGSMDGSANGGLNDTWTWNGTTWTQKSPATVPPTRQQATMDYDLARGVIVMFGGRIHGGPAGPTGAQNDLWEWDGTDWTLIPAINPPGIRYSANMVYDIGRGVHVLWGGVNASNVGYNETWEYDPTTQTWTQIFTAASPGSRVYAGMAYDLSRGRTVLYGGRDDAFQPLTPLFWEYDGSNWTTVAPSRMPGDMYGHAMVFDQQRGRIVMQGGRGPGFLSGTWEYDGVHCYHYNAEASPAAGSYFAATAYDLLRDRMVVCGGYNTSLQRSNDTWERDPARPGYALFGTGGVSLSSSSLPALGTTFTLNATGMAPTSSVAWFVIGFSNTAWGSLPLPLDLGVFGWPGLTAYVSPDATSLQPIVGGSASWNLALPNHPAFGGLRLFTQAIELTNVGGLVFSNAGQAIAY